MWATIWSLRVRVHFDFEAMFWPGVVYPKQVRFVLGSAARFQAFIGGIGSGKSWALMLKALYLSLSQQPGAVGWITGRTGRDLAQTLIPQFMDHCQTFAEGTGINLVKSYNRAEQWITLINGVHVGCRPYDRPDKLRGPSISWCVADEIEYALQPEYTFDVLNGRIRQRGRVYGQIAVATTPRGLVPGSVVAKFLRMRQTEPEQWFAVHATIFDNPTLDASYVQSVKAGYSRRLWLQEGLGQILRPSDAVFEIRNTADEDGPSHFVDWVWDPDLPYVIGIDWGATSAAAVCAQVTRDGRWIVCDELLGEDCGFMGFRRQLEAWIASFGAPPAMIAADRAVRSENGWLRQRFGGHSEIRTAVTKNEQSLVRGVEMIRSQLEPTQGPPRLMLSTSLQSVPLMRTGPLHIVDALNAWKYRRGPEGPTNKPENQPDNRAKHVIDALRYAVVASARLEWLHGGQVIPFLNAEGLANSPIA